MCSLIEGSDEEEEWIEYKLKKNIYNDDPDAPHVGPKWWALFLRRNFDIASMAEQRFQRNRAGHCNHDTFTKMYDNFERGLVDSGNAERYEKPVHMNMEGNIVEDETLAFGRPVTIRITRPENAIVANETGCNTHGSEDAKKGGQKRVVPRGETPRRIVGIKNAHFTVTPFNDLTGRLVCLVIIFKGDKLNPLWAIGLDVFKDWVDGKFENNFGPGKRHPGLSIFDEDGEEVPVLFFATPKASMTTYILYVAFKCMNDMGKVGRGVDENGKKFYPMSILDGHHSRMGEKYLVYVNNEPTRWYPYIGAPYGTGHWQFHDDQRQNGAFKMALSEAKEKWFKLKQRHGFEPEVLPTEVLTVLREPIDQSFNNMSHARHALAIRGLNPFNRNCLDHPEILVSATKHVQKERARILRSRGITSTAAVRAPPTTVDLLETGSGLLAGGRAAGPALRSTIEGANLYSHDATEVFDIMHQQHKKEEGRRKHMSEEREKLTDKKVVNSRYADAKAFTASIAFGRGNGYLGPDAAAEVSRRNRAKEKRVKAQIQKQKEAHFKLEAEVKAVRKKMKKKNFSFTRELLRPLVKWKKKAKEKLPVSKADMLQRWEETKDRTSPTCSPLNSEVEDMTNEEIADGEDEEANNPFVMFKGGSDERGLVFDDSDDDDDASSLDGSKKKQPKKQTKEQKAQTTKKKAQPKKQKAQPTKKKAQPKKKPQKKAEDVPRRRSSQRSVPKQSYVEEDDEEASDEEEAATSEDEEASDEQVSSEDKDDDAFE